MLSKLPLRQASNSEPDEIKTLETELAGLRKEQESHREMAQKSHQHYVKATTECKELEEKTTLSDDEKETLAVAKQGFILVLCADYQQCKLVPFWGMSDQPGSTYYLQKLNHDLFGIVNHADNTSAVTCSMRLSAQRIPIIHYHYCCTTSAHSLLG